MLDYHQPHMLDLMCHFHSGSGYQRCSWSLLHLSCNHPIKISSLKLTQLENKVFTELNKQLNLISRHKPCLLSIKWDCKKFPTWLPLGFKFLFLVRHPTKKHLNKRAQFHVLFTWPSNYTVATSNLFPTPILSSNWYIINAISLTAKLFPNLNPFPP